MSPSGFHCDALRQCNQIGDEDANLMDSITNFNLIVGVLSAFILLGKLFLHILRIFVPPLSAILHAVLFSLFVVSTRYQAGSDMSDSRHPQPGPPWYITKNCNVAYSASNIGY